MGNGPGGPGPPLFRCEIQAPGGDHHNPAPPPRRQAQLTAAHHLERAPEAASSDGMTGLPVNQVLTERGEQVGEPAQQVPQQVKEIHVIEYRPPSGASPRAAESPGTGSGSRVPSAAPAPGRCGSRLRTGSAAAAPPTGRSPRRRHTGSPAPPRPPGGGKTAPSRAIQRPPPHTSDCG